MRVAGRSDETVARCSNRRATMLSAFVLFAIIGGPLPAAVESRSSFADPAPPVGEKQSSNDQSERIVANANSSPAGAFRDGVLTLHLEVGSGAWYPEAENGPSVTVQAFGEAGGPLQIPGPLIRVPEGTEIHATIHNALPDSTVVLYGLHTRPGSARDTLHVAPGASREVRFEAGAPGTYYYWGTTTGLPMEEREGVDSQLTGALIVDPAGTTSPDDRVFVIGLWFQPADFTGPKPVPEQEVMVINGKSWPHTERLTFTQGDTARWRWINASVAPHPMHLHGFYYQVGSRGSWGADTIYTPSQRRLVATELMPPGGTMAVRWAPVRLGNWVFHCHFAFHVSPLISLTRQAESMAVDGQAPAVHGDAVHGMAGLVLGLHILPRADGRSAVRKVGNARRLRLLVQSAAARFGEAAGYGYVLHEGATEPAPDSILIPGPLLLLQRDEPVSITVVNRLKEPTAVHWHGIELESFPDGVPGWSGTPGRIMPPIAPGDSFVAEFVPPRAGTFIYHSHSNELLQINSGLYGPLIVVEPGRSPDPSKDHLVLAGGGGLAEDGETPGLVNGSDSPPPINLEVGVTHRFRLINIHPDWRVRFTLLGESELAGWRAIAKDGADLPEAQAILRPAQLVTGPGETADFEFTPSKAGTLRLDVATVGSGWHIPLTLRVRDAASP